MRREKIENPGETARRIRDASPAGRCPRLVAVTADVFEESRRQCIASGIVDFLNKPFRRAALASVYPTAQPHGPKGDPFALMLDVGATLHATADDLVGKVLDAVRVP